MRELLNQYLYQREWSIYPFIPPVFSLLLGLVFIPSYEGLIDARISNLLIANGVRNDNAGNRLDLVKSTMRARGLQVAYLTELPNFAIAIISTVQGNYPNLVLAAWLLATVLTLFAGNLFLRKPDYVANTHFPKKRKPRWLAKFNLKQIDLYAGILPILTVVLIFIIVLTLPEKKHLLSH
jgi:hypothetical protein